MLPQLIFGLAALASNALAIPTIYAKGSKFFTSNGNQFYIKGIAYQLTNDDPLVNGTQCALDANLMKTLGTNTIRVYHVDATANHDDCMQTFSDAGIYVFLDLDTFSTYIIASSPAWTESQFDSYAAVMDTFHGYDNVAGFFVGNEVLTSGANSIAAPYVKAAGADLKAYRDAKGYRNIPIGYSAADIPALRPNLQNYMGCSTNSSENLDFFSLNAYEWCGDNTFTGSGYSELEANATNYNIPIYFSETGCIVPKPRLFQDQSAILGPDMDNTWSGAIIYEWIEEDNNYGLISYGPPAPSGDSSPDVVAGYTRQGTPTPIQPDFENLSSQWATLTPTGVSASAYDTSTITPPACPAYTSGYWMVDNSSPLPTIGQSYVAGAAANSNSTGGSSATGSSTAGSSGGSSSATHTGSSSATHTGSSSAKSGSTTSTSGGSGQAASASASPSKGAASSFRHVGRGLGENPSPFQGKVWYIGAALASAISVILFM